MHNRGLERSKLSRIFVGLVLFAMLPQALAGSAREDGEQAYRNGEYDKAAMAWFGGAMTGDSEQQELLADLLLGPHEKVVRHHEYDGIKYLYRAAIGGRHSAMLKLSNLLSTGKSGAIRLPMAAKCWSALPKDYPGIISCVETTEFKNVHARATCAELVMMGRPASFRNADGATMARLCLANRTPALLVPGAPPSERDLRRVTEYARGGLEWIITGDVYNGDFEKFRDDFNNAIVAKVEAERGRGYLERLEKQIENRIAREQR